ncbi:hypothetical protein [Cellulomonas chitinilytica]|uniref:hypothetical protein n=1 Tax=Cellulomonas chitinilytica TaxID=398759 RepID=UPI0019410269|nr:hypothetical protein [Cellulomonas chitinilytica]
MLLLAACTSSGNAPEASTSAPTQAAPTTAAPSLSAEDEAASAAAQVVSAYFRTVVSCLADPPNSPSTCFDGVTIATERTNMNNALISAQQAKTKAVGSIEVVSTERRSVDLSGDPSATPPVAPTVVLRVCSDGATFDVLNSAGQSVIPATQPDREVADVTVVDYGYPDATQWRVGLVTPVQGATC